MVQMEEIDTRTTTGTEPMRIRLIIDTTERIREAASLRSYKLSAERHRKVKVSEFVNELLEKVLADELAELSGEKKPRKKAGS